MLQVSRQSSRFSTTTIASGHASSGKGLERFEDGVEKIKWEQSRSWLKLGVITFSKLCASRLGAGQKFKKKNQAPLPAAYARSGCHSPHESKNDWMSSIDHSSTAQSGKSRNSSSALQRPSGRCELAARGEESHFVLFERIEPQPEVIRATMLDDWMIVSVETLVMECGLPAAAIMSLWARIHNRHE